MCIANGANEERERYQYVQQYSNDSGKGNFAVVLSSVQENSMVCQVLDARSRTGIIASSMFNEVWFEFALLRVCNYALNFSTGWLRYRSEASANQTPPRVVRRQPHI